MRAASVTGALSHALAEAGIPALFYKGAALSAQLGEKVGERPAVDVDLLVERTLVPAVGAVLEARGFEHEARHPGVPFRIEVRLECERTYRGPGPSADLHWAVDSSRSFRRPFAELWARRAPVRVSGAEVWTLDPVEALLVTCVHGAREQWRQWKWLVDAGRQVALLDPPTLSSARVLAQQTRSQRPLALTLAMLEQIGAVDLPPAVRSGPSAQRLAEEALIGSVRAPAVDRRPAAGVRRRWWKWRISDSPSDALAGLTGSMARQATQLATRSQVRGR